MKIFLDSADLGEIKEGLATGLVDGITTNPSLIAKSGQPFLRVLEEICALTPGPVSAEVVATDTAGMLAEAAVLQRIAPNIVIKIPLTVDGLRTTQALAKENIKTNVTLCFSANQALLAMKSGASFLSPFLGRYAQHGGDAAALLQEIMHLKHSYGFSTAILAASIRDTSFALLAAHCGADYATMGLKVLQGMLQHDLTDSGLQAFLADWQKTGQKIL